MNVRAFSSSYHHGDALLKVYATDNTDMAAWAEVIQRFISEENAPLVLKAKETPDAVANADAQTVDQEWRAMTDAAGSSC